MKILCRCLLRVVVVLHSPLLLKSLRMTNPRALVITFSLFFEYIPRFSFVKYLIVSGGGRRSEVKGCCQKMEDEI